MNVVELQHYKKLDDMVHMAMKVKRKEEAHVWLHLHQHGGQIKGDRGLPNQSVKT
jgi:hypothetical protein